MSNLLRCGLIAAGIVAAFAGGYFLRNVPDRTSDSAAIASEAVRPIPKTAKSRAFNPTSGGPVVVVADRRVANDFPPVILPPAVSPSDAKKDDYDPAELQMIKRGLNIQTTVLDKSLPVPSVLAQATKSESPPIPPIDLDIRPTSPPPIIVGPGPLPPQDRPPPLAIPPIKTNDPFSPPTIPIPDLSPPKPPEAPAPLPRKLLVNTRQIELDFAVTKTGLSKIKAVELWTTRDGGINWVKTDEMEGCVSPFKTRLGSEGEFGFWLVFKSESGRQTSSPSSRVQPMIELDTTAPSASFHQIDQSPSKADHTRIEWTMSDGNLDLGHVKLDYSTDAITWHRLYEGAMGPADSWFKRFPEGVQLAGERIYFRDWLPPPNLPYELHFRLRVQDKAGNSTVIQTPTKVSIDQVAPEGKITGVRAMGSEPEKGPMPRAVDNRQVFSFWIGLFQ
jgi:hypothetical protein